MKNDLSLTKNYGIDLLRILCMLMIIIMHMLWPGGIVGKAPFLSLKYEIFWFLETACFCSVNCYALISGYVGYNAKYHYTNFILLWLRVVFYTVFITGLFQIFQPQLVTTQTWLNAFAPVMTSQYWYFSSYTVLFFFIPFLNTIIQTLSKKKLTMVLCVLTTLFCILPVIFQKNPFVLSYGYSGWWLIFLYLIGGYIKKLTPLTKVNFLFCFILYFGMVFITWLLKFIIESYNLHFFHRVHYNNYLLHYNSITILIAAICLFYIFIHLRLGTKICRIIQYLTPSVFSVYLIHVHPLIFQHLWQNNFSFVNNFSLPIALCFIFTVACVLFLTCYVIDLLRETIFKSLHLKEKLLKLEIKLFGNLWN